MHHKTKTFKMSKVLQKVRDAVFQTMFTKEEWESELYKRERSSRSSRPFPSNLNIYQLNEYTIIQNLIKNDLISVCLFLCNEPINSVKIETFKTCLKIFLNKIEFEKHLYEEHKIMKYRCFSNDCFNISFDQK